MKEPARMDAPRYVVSAMPCEVDGHEQVLFVAQAVFHRVWDVVGCATVHLDGPPLLCDLFVKERYRRRGVATRIVWRALNHAAFERQPLYTYYLPDSPARPLLEEMGFEDTGERGVGDTPTYIWAQHTAHHDLVPYTERSAGDDTGADPDPSGEHAIEAPIIPDDQEVADA